VFAVTVAFVVQVEWVDAFISRVLRQAEDSLTYEDNCHVFDVCRDSKIPNRIFLYEVYTDEEAFKIHLASEHYLSFDQETKTWVQSKTPEFFNRL
jgi:(4S)-4-hydroxy-5-phosphonooxypentane-2,3-dione isomerase